MLDHFLGDVEIGDHAVTQRTNCEDAAGRPAKHHLGLVADRQNLFLAFDLVNRDNRGLVQADPAPFDINQRVRGSQVDRHVGGQHSK